MSLTVADVRDLWMEVRAEIQPEALRAVGEYKRPDLELQLALAAVTMPPDVRALLSPEVMTEMLEVFDGRKKAA